MKKKYPKVEVKTIREIRVRKPSMIPTVETFMTSKTNQRDGWDSGFKPKRSKRG